MVTETTMTPTQNDIPTWVYLTMGSLLLFTVICFFVLVAGNVFI